MGILLLNCNPELLYGKKVFSVSYKQ